MVGQGPCATGAAACVAAGQALAFVEGRLAPAEHTAVEQRIAACPGCRAVVANVARRASGASEPRRAREHSDDAVAHTEQVIELVGGRPSTAAYRAKGRAPAAPAEAGVPPTVRERSSPVSPPAAPALGLAPGEVVGRYVVERPLGAGGMGVVSLARDPELHRPVVIKLVHPSMGYGEGGDEFEARLRREAQAMAQLSHANVVQIFDIGRRGDRVFLATEFVAGRTLDVWLLEKPRSHDEILGVFRQAGAGLAAAHRAGLVHRDFKPTNVLVGNDGVVKVIDFGLARSFSGSGAAGATRRLRVAEVQATEQGDAFDPLAAAHMAVAPRPSGVHAVLTQVDSVVGTPAYMSPEQAAGGRIDARSDQYAFAVTLLDALLGQSPSRRRVAPRALPPVIDGGSKPGGRGPAGAAGVEGVRPLTIDEGLEHAGVAAPVREALKRALTEEPAARFPTIDELLHALSPPPRRSRRAVLVAIGVVLCGGAAAVWLAAGRAEPPSCVAQAPGRWTGAPRARVVAALAASPRPFTGWTADRVATAIDAAVASLADAELARCHGTPVASAGGSAGSADCIARRSAALGTAIDALSASPPPDDPWPAVRPVQQCDAVAGPELAAVAAFRRELPAATAARARAIADAARRASDDLLAADALEVAGLAALAAGDPTAADADLLAMNEAGERGGDDATRGRALLHLIDAARSRGEHATAKRDLDELRAMVARHGGAPHDDLAVALVEGDAFNDLGDVAIAFAAWDRAGTAAGALGDRDAALAAAIGRARSTQALRFDVETARADATAALAAAGDASPAARAAALATMADLALAARDGSAAQAALADARRLVPAREHLLGDQLRGQRARALLGDVDPALTALSELAAASLDDAATVARIDIARGHLLLAADRASDARDIFEKVERDVRGFGRTLKAIALNVPERIEFELATCEAQVATGERCKASYQLENMVKGLHPRAPVRARFAIIDASSDALRALPPLRTQRLTTALDILVDAQAEPVQLAELRWQLAQLGTGSHDHRGLAQAAREVFQSHGRAAEVADIDRWLAALPPGPVAPTTPAPQDRPRRDPRGPQP